MGGGQNYVCGLLRNVHLGLQPPADASEIELVTGDYLYYHYGCDGFDDRELLQHKAVLPSVAGTDGLLWSKKFFDETVLFRQTSSPKGWGCGYRTLMTLCSWTRGQLKSQESSDNLPPVPSNCRIQEVLVEIGDKESDILGSKQWIGSVEVCHVLDTLYGVPSKIIHVNSGKELSEHISTLADHFKKKGAPVMMGGETDASSKGIMGVCKSSSQNYLLVVDPHFWGEVTDAAVLHANGWVTWKPLSDFHESSFYNICLPQFTAVH